MHEGTFAYVRGWKREFESKGWWHSFDLPDGRHIEGVCSVEGLRNRISRFPIPEDLRGARVLDIGSWDGWYSFEMERRGAQVVAVDCWKNPRFGQIHSALQSKVEFRLMDVYDLTPATVGRFDIVLFMGVLYHLKHPLLALERICALSTELAAVDSFILREEHLPGLGVEQRPVMEFYETDEFGGQTDNWCGPSLSCLMAMCRTAGFARVEHRATLPTGACVACYRKWEPSAKPHSAAPQLLDALHHTNFGINFESSRDEYVSAVFRIAESDARPRSVEPRVGDYGVKPIHVSHVKSDAWQVNFKLPPGLTPGWHDVSLRTDDGPFSNAKQIAVDLPLPASDIRIAAVADGRTWEQGAMNLTQGDVLAAWVYGLPQNADRSNVAVQLGGEPMEVLCVVPGGPDSAGQVNVRVPPEVPLGTLEFEIALGGGPWQSIEVRIVGE